MSETMVERAHAPTRARDLERYIARKVGPITLEKVEALGVREARRRQLAWRQDHGRSSHGELLTKNAKLLKGNVPSWGVELAPAGMSGYQVCRWRTAGCEAACLGHGAGRNQFDEVREGKVLRTQWLAEDPVAFVAVLIHEIRLILKAERKRARRLRKRRRRVAIRLNVTSDLRWDLLAPALWEAFWAELEAGTLVLYDYTKERGRSVPFWHLTESSHENMTDADILARVADGATVTVPVAVGRNDPLPTTWRGAPAIDGDKHDNRFDDPAGVVVLLRAKGGAAMRDASGFVRSA